MYCFVDVRREGQEVVSSPPRISSCGFRTWTSKNRIWWRRDVFGHPALFSHLSPPGFCAHSRFSSAAGPPPHGVPRTHLRLGGWTLVSAGVVAPDCSVLS